jgi:hypothetical protein
MLTSFSTVSSSMTIVGNKGLCPKVLIHRAAPAVIVQEKGKVVSDSDRTLAHSVENEYSIH